MTNKPLAMRAVVAALIIVAIATFAAVPMWTPKPQVEYNMTGYAYIGGLANAYGPIYTDKMPYTYTLVNANTPLIVAINWENKGAADASLQLTLTVQNANITWFSNFGTENTTTPAWATAADGQAYNGTTANFLSEAKANSTTQFKYVDVMPIGNPQNFTITFSVSDTANGFSSVSPGGTASATYELQSGNVYNLAT